MTLMELVEATKRFQDWSRTPAGRAVLSEAGEGPEHAQEALSKAFIRAVASRTAEEQARHVMEIAS